LSIHFQSPLPRRFPVPVCPSSTNRSLQLSPYTRRVDPYHAVRLGSGLHLALFGL
jgi:hypothetical protein